MSKFDAPALTDAEDKKIFFMCRKQFAPEDEKIDESTYDTASFQPVDLFPYLITNGYRTEKDREGTSLEQCKKIKEKRAEYGLPPLVDAYSTKRLQYGSEAMSEEEFKREWLMFTYGRGNGGLPVLWNNAGAVKDSVTKRYISEKGLGDKTKIYCTDVCEQLTKLKFKLSKARGERITKHYAVLDVSNMGITNVTKLKGFISNALADVQVMYPESLQKQYIFNAGWLFRGVWSIVKLFIHPLTRKKIEILKDFKALKKKLVEDGVTMIPKEFGGDGEGAIYGGDSVYDAPGFKDPHAPKAEESKTEEPAKADDNKAEDADKPAEEPAPAEAAAAAAAAE